MAAAAAAADDEWFDDKLADVFLEWAASADRLISSKIFSSRIA